MIEKQSDNHLKNPDQITAAATDDHHHHQNATTFKSTPSSSTTTSSSSWSRFKDPRIVRVSRALGGKDRHSKVCTVRGLRDRRVRLSVPTAIQLYDLQERLGLNQPSKVVDWLLNAAKHDIDELPPLQIPQGFFTTSVNNHNDINLLNFQSDKRGLKIGASASADDSGSGFLRGKTKDDEVMSHDRDENNTWASAQEETRQFHLENNDHSNHLVLLSNNSSASAINSSYDSFVRLDPSNLTLSHDAPRTNQQHEYWHNFGLLPSAFPFAYHHHQPSATQSYFPSRIGELDFQRSQLSNSPLSSNIDSANQRVEQMHFNMTANLLPSQDDNNDGSNR